jgi:hypothetical protein
MVVHSCNPKRKRITRLASGENMKVYLKKKLTEKKLGPSTGSF